MLVRVLDTSILAKSLNELGFTQELKEKFIHAITRSQGFILVTGPTGSGKTTTLYAALSHLHTPEKNIITLEDPAEYTLAGITQGKINHDTGFNFRKGIRAILRQDPDILMVGEIRDRATARTAIEASLTGHLVLSTLHTNDAASAIVRLLDMKIEPFLLNASLSAVLAQRLVRRLCSQCKIAEKLTDEELQIDQKLTIDFNQIFKAAGCKSCHNTGYKGRIGVFELLIVTPELRNHIRSAANIKQLARQAVLDGLITMREDGIEKMKNGLISFTDFVSTIN